MNTRFQSTLAASGYSLPKIGFGTGTLTRRTDYFGKAAERDTAVSAIKGALLSPFSFLDTARNYGDGIAEQWIGEALVEMGGMPSGALISTKLDREPGSDVFDAGRARQSLEQSLAALGIDRVPILFLHDPEHARSRAEVTAQDGPLRELMRMKEEGLATTVGLAGGNTDLMLQILPDWDFDAVLTHSRYTIVNRTAGHLIDTASTRGIAVINAAVMGSGILATGATPTSRYVYQAPSDQMLTMVGTVEALCAKFNLPIAAVALQFSLRDPRIASTVVGISRPERIRQTVEIAALHVPDELWAQLFDLTTETVDPESGRQV